MSARIPKSVALFPVLVVLGLAYLRETHFRFYLSLVLEDQLLEKLQFGSYMVASVIAALMVLNLRRRGEVLLSGAYAVLCVGLFFVAMEEISWGQRLFEIKPPAYFLEHNLQRELTLHNLEPIQAVLHYGYILVGLYGCFAFLCTNHSLRIRHRKLIGMLTPSPALFLYFLPVVLFYSYFEWMDKVMGITPKWFDQEPAEFFLSLGFLAFVLGNRLQLDKLLKGDDGTQASAAPPPLASPTAPSITTTESLNLGRWNLVLLSALVLIAVSRIVATYPVFSQTWVEPVNIAAGVQWLDQGQYDVDPRQPPLARVAIGLGPFLDGAVFQDSGNKWDDGNEILHSNETYWRRLTLARLAILPFLSLAVVVLWLLTRHLLGTDVAVVAVVLFTTLPPVIAHSTLAGLDLALTATLGLSVYLCIRWLERPTLSCSLIFGFTVGAALLTKFSALPYVLGCTLLIAGWRAVCEKPGTRYSADRLWRTGVVVLAALLVVWAGYLFSFGSVHPGSLSVAAPEYFRGLERALAHQERGHRVYFLGEVGQHGWWYYFPVMLGFKTPVAFLLLSLLGLKVLFAQSWAQHAWKPLAPLLAVLAILLVAMNSQVNSGVRHVLPVYLFLAVTASAGLLWLWQRARTKSWALASVVTLTVWYAAASVTSHPDYLAYFNEAAGTEPGRISVDSDLDWGQNLARLALVLEELEAERVYIAYNGSADLSRHPLPLHWRELPANQPVNGWIAISEHSLRTRTEFQWLEDFRPAMLIGKSIRLYRISDL